MPGKYESSAFILSSVPKRRGTDGHTPSHVQIMNNEQRKYANNLCNYQDKAERGNCKCVFVSQIVYICIPWLLEPSRDTIKGLTSILPLLYTETGLWHV